MLFSHAPLGFSLEFPDSWTVAWYGNPTALEAYSSRMQTRADALPLSGDFSHIVAAQDLGTAKDSNGTPYETFTNTIEIVVWKDEPFKLPSRAKRFPLGELPFKARLGPYGNGGLHAAGQLDVGNGYVLHLTIRSDSPEATSRLQPILATGKRLAS
jgi:hypothetical protein